MPSKSSQRKKRKRFQQGRRTASGVLGHEAVIDQFVGLQRFFETTLLDRSGVSYHHRSGDRPEWIYRPSNAKTLTAESGDWTDPDTQEMEWIQEHLRRLKNARVYTVDPALYTHLYEEAHETVMRDIGLSAVYLDALSEDAVADMTSFDGDISEWVSSADTEAAAHMRSYARAWGDEIGRRSAAVALFNVDHLPFQHTYFGYDDGFLLDTVDLAQRFGNLDLGALERVWVVGHLFSADGTVVEFFRTEVGVLPVSTASHSKYGFGYGTLREPDGWKCGNSLMPVILTNLLETVHGLHTTFVTQVPVPKAHRKTLKKVGQEVIPEEFYLVRIRPKHITVNQRTKDGDEETPKRKLTYRRDRAGHVRCLFQTDKLPLDPAVKRSLIERGYSVYEDYRPVAPNHMAYAIERGKPLRQPGYWWAILVTHVKEHQFPSDPTLPYRPANRLVQ